MNTPGAGLIVVKDASILIDLLKAEILEDWFALGIPTITTDLVAHEMKPDSRWQTVQALIASGALQVVEFGHEVLATIIEIKRSKNVSLADGSVLFLSRERNAMLLTGDRRLRASAKSEGIEVRGVLWVLDVLVSKKIITAKRAGTAMDTMLDQGARLPVLEVENRRARWSKN